MKSQKKDPTRNELIAELENAHRRIAELEQLVAQHNHSGQPEIGTRYTSGQILDLFVRYAPASIAMFDREMKYIAASRRYLTDYQLKDQDIIGRSHYEIFPEIPQRWKDIHQRCLNGTIEKADEDPFPREDGTLDWVRWEIHPWHEASGKIGGIILFSEVITARKLVEEKLNRNEERLRLALKAANQGLYDLNVQTGDAIVNAEYALMLGYDPADFHETNSFWIERLHPDDQEHTATTYREYIAGNIPEYRVEFRQKTKRGDWKWILSLGKIVEYDASEKPLRMLGTHTDITERKQAEEALKKGEQKYSALFENSAVPAALTKMPEAVFVDVNEAFRTTYGYTREDVIGKTSIEIGMALPDEHMRTAIELEKHSQLRDNEKHLFTKTGEARIAAISVGKVVIDRQDYVITTIHDVTERKQAEEALRQSRENFARAFNSNPAALAITRIDDGTFLILNEAYTNIMGYEPIEVLGHTVADLNIYVNSDERNQLLHQLHERGRVRNYELLVRSKSGKTRSLLVSMESILYDETQCILSTFIDITERKQMEEELRRSNAELEQFAYVASHDLQEPLRAVAGMVQLLGQRYKGRLDESADEYISHAVEASTRMQNLINDLLDYSRVDRGERPFERTSMEQVLNTALANLQIPIQESQAQITRDPLPTLMADTGQMIQVLQNLIGNAIKFRDDGPLHIHVHAEKIDDAWRFSVSDNGIGIEPQYFARVFLVFQRLHTRRQYPGTGIGLSLCKKIIERHGGQIWVESQLGHGATFYFTLPEKKL